MTMAGIGAGVAGALVLTRSMSSLLFGVSAADPLIYAAVSVLLAAVALVAAAVPASRATRIDPLVALRGHDLRRTAASLMASGGVPRFVISRILNHSDDKDITSVYDRYGYDAQKRAAMEFWNHQLTAILKGKATTVAQRFRM
jgi:integrase